MGKRNSTDPLDLDMLAYDISDLLDKFEYPISDTIGPDEIRAALPAFLASLGLDLNGRPLGAPTGAPVNGSGETHTVHNCNPNQPGKPLPFGRRDPRGLCPRCKELDNGAEPRPAPQWVDEYRRVREFDARQAEEIKAHFAPGSPHARGECGPVCTAFDW